MKDKKKKEKRKINNIFIFGIILLISLVIITGVVFAQSQSQEDLETELSGLIDELANSDYSWLVDYSGELPAVEPAEIEVYTQDNDTLITKFENINENEVNEI